jgi:hypothetical protein
MGSEKMASLKERALDYYEKNDTKVDIAFFLGGFIFDVLTLSDVDDALSIGQQVIYLFVIGSILYYDFLATHGFAKISERVQRFWDYRQLAVHFLLGSLLSVYSLFFLKSASFFSSIIFVLLMMGIMVANELKSVQKSAVDLKVGLYVICVFAFFSMTIPVLLGFVGLLPFLLAIAFTALVLYGVFRLLQRRVPDQRLLFKTLAIPGASILGLFLVLYLIGWIPPVPLSVQNMGVYHMIEKVGGNYVVSHENPWWRFWQKGDQTFRAEPGDKIYFFAEIFSPARFSDSVTLHWYFKDPRTGWISTDRIPMKISGGRKNGFRGFAIKQNYTDGEFRISVETTDGREIGRIYFEVTKAPEASQRTFINESF